MANNAESKVFTALVTGSGESLLQTFFRYASLKQEGIDRLKFIAKKIHINADSLCCAVGFNPHTEEYIEIVNNLGFEDIESFIHRRDYIFTNDVYKKLSIESLLALYGSTEATPKYIAQLENLLPARLERLENYIEKTVSALTINKYRSELEAIYKHNIASIPFAESRLDNTNSGFRALSNEVLIMAENKMLPVGEIFFRENILPQEKRKLLNKGLVPKDLVLERLQDPTISAEEKKVLKNF